MIRLAAAAGLLALALPGLALADPCRAIPDHGPAPAYLHRGAEFSGRVAYVGDGDSLCVALGPSPAAWVEVRLADFYAPELHGAGGEAAKAALVRLAYGRRVECVADHQSYDRIVATCWLNGRSLGDLLASTGEAQGGRGWRRYR
jgi:micrococcal nuclease